MTLSVFQATITNALGGYHMSFDLDELEVTTSGGLVYTCLQSDFTIKETSI